ncbi:hypothetical protein JZ751_009526 [Albula glossodonta]|uniref:Dysbindin n=1 Tax=Albula glossodonta TaxID=121402 RepID=A0A8T2NZS4_9TELE|nr:hypothetical protein JZ751_009526 [Albula glossodonta]
MFENFRERLQTAHQDLTTGIKTLSDKSKEAKIKKTQRREDNLPQFSAGVELLSRYEDTWVTLHKRAKECAKAAEAVDGEVVMLSAHWERRRAALVELHEQLQQIPAFLTDLESITSRIGDTVHLERPLRVANLPSLAVLSGHGSTGGDHHSCPAPIESGTTTHLEGDFEEMESRLLHLEDLCSQCEQQRAKHYQRLQLENYKMKKRKELESLKGGQDMAGDGFGADLIKAPFSWNSVAKMVSFD